MDRFESSLTYLLSLFGLMMGVNEDDRQLKLKPNAMIEIKKLQNSTRKLWRPPGMWNLKVNLHLCCNSLTEMSSIPGLQLVVQALYNIERADTSPFLVHFSLLSQCSGMRAVWPKSHHNHLEMAEGEYYLSLETVLSYRVTPYAPQ